MFPALKAIGWTSAELAPRLSVREDSVRHWLNGRRPIPPNVEHWLCAVRDSFSSAPALPDGWQHQATICGTEGNSAFPLGNDDAG